MFSTQIFEKTKNQARQQQLAIVRNQSERVSKLTHQYQTQQSQNGNSPFTENTDYILEYDLLYGQEELNQTNFAKAIFDFVPDENNTGLLTFKKDDILIIHSKEESGWWTGKIYDKVGHFPATHVKPITEMEVQIYIQQQQKSGLPHPPEQSLKIDTSPGASRDTSRDTDIPTVPIEPISPTVYTPPSQLTPPRTPLQVESQLKGVEVPLALQTPPTDRPREVPCDMSPRNVSGGMSRETPREVSPKDGPREVSSRILPRRMSPRDVPREVSPRNVPHEMSSRDVPREVSREMSPKDVPRGMSPRDVPREVPREMSPSDVPREVSREMSPKDVPRDILRDLSEDDIQIQIQITRSTLAKVNEELEKIRADVDRERHLRHTLWNSIKPEVEQINPEYYDVAPLEELLYDVRSVLALLDADIDSQRDDVKAVDATLIVLEGLMHELGSVGQLKHVKKELDPLVLEYQQKLVMVKASSDEKLRYSPTQNLGHGKFYDMLGRFADLLENLVLENKHSLL